MDKSVYRLTEFDKILYAVSEYACLEQTKEYIKQLEASSNLVQVRRLLDSTKEADALLYSLGAGGVEYFGDASDILKLARSGASLNCAELLSVAALLRSSRLLKNSVCKDEYEQIVYLKQIASDIYTDVDLENEIKEKIISEDKVSDNASERLYSIRKKIVKLNVQIKEKLQSYLVKYSKYIQDSIITIRSDRYVIPVKTEYKGMVKGFVHDQSASGSTVFIEPEYILEINNELKTAQIDEKLEIERILAELSAKAGAASDSLSANICLISEIDSFYARAVYSYKNKCVMPKVNSKGVIKISKGRHPLIDKEKVVPVSLSVGEGYNFLLISGPNTGGKTVSLKMTGLFSLMAASGIFLPCADAEVSVFDKIFCDIGDSQSIENELSTFSSHIKELKKITEEADSKSLVLIDELGDGTDPEEGQALALAVIERLLERKSIGIITTHFSALKEFALKNPLIENASMEFDAQTFSPLYKLMQGIPGSSNAIAISERLGMDKELVKKAISYLSEEKISFESTLQKAEEVRIRAERELLGIEQLKKEAADTKEQLEREREKLRLEKEKIIAGSRVEIRRIVAERTEEAEELLEKIKEISQKQELTAGDIILSKTLKNKLLEKQYLEDAEDEPLLPLIPLKESQIQQGAYAYVKSIEKNCIILSVSVNKRQVEVMSGNIKYRCKFSELYAPIEHREKSVKPKREPVKKSVQTPALEPQAAPLTEIKLLGKTAAEALQELDSFIDAAAVSGLEQVKIIHGVGTGRLREEIRKYLKLHPMIESFRAGKYGEGENGVTIALIK